MANTIRIKRRASGGAAGAPASLENAELAYNEVDDVLYYGKGTGGAGGTATSVEAIGGAGAYLTLSGTQTITGNKTFSGTTIVPTPTANTHAVTKLYVDNAISGVTLGNTAVTVGSYGGAGTVATFTVQGDGRLTAAGNTTISITASQISDRTTNLVTSVTGTTNEVTVSGTGTGPWTGAVTIGLPDDVTITNTLTVTGDLVVNGNTTTLNTSTLTVEDKNIVLANVATPTDTTADGAGITIKGSSDKTMTWSNTTKSFTFNQGLDIKQIIETVTANATAINANTTIDVLDGAVSFYTANVAANWTLNVRANSTTRLDAVMGTNDSMTIAYLATQLGSNTFYQSAMQIDGTAVTPKWQGGSAPSAGNATSIDLYAFTIIKTAANTYTVLGSQTQYA